MVCECEWGPFTPWHLGCLGSDPRELKLLKSTHYMKFNAIGLVFTTLVATAPVMATTFSFQPFPDTDLQDLPHAYYYGWKIDWQNMPANEQIVSATLSISNLRNWRSVPTAEKDVLFLQMMDWTGSAPSGMSTYLGLSNQPGYTSMLYRGFDKPPGVSEADMPASNAFAVGSPWDRSTPSRTRRGRPRSYNLTIPNSPR